ncbi:hypothetical protein [Photobacterium sp. SKA34]|uniref:hypothetical protein n=1 Tax=Photobacterium sp. SKA34 TaxID=121723 RepID=UPI0003196B54|nr:hypothetical protein [Photobacterium sp. SKA34]
MKFIRLYLLLALFTTASQAECVYTEGNNVSNVKTTALSAITLSSTWGEDWNNDIYEQRTRVNHTTTGVREQKWVPLARSISTFSQNDPTQVVYKCDRTSDAILTIDSGIKTSQAPKQFGTQDNVWQTSNIDIGVRIYIQSGNNEKVALEKASTIIPNFSNSGLNNKRKIIITAEFIRTPRKNSEGNYIVPSTANIDDIILSLKTSNGSIIFYKIKIRAPTAIKYNSGICAVALSQNVIDLGNIPLQTINENPLDTNTRLSSIGFGYKCSTDIPGRLTLGLFFDVEDIINVGNDKYILIQNRIVGDAAAKNIFFALRYTNLELFYNNFHPGNWMTPGWNFHHDRNGDWVDFNVRLLGNKNGKELSEGKVESLVLWKFKYL